VVGRLSYRNSPNPPASGLSDPLPLLMNEDRGAEVRLQGAPFDNAAVYFAANTRFRRNSRRNLELEQDATSVGAWAQVTPRLNLNVDHSVLWADSRNLPIARFLSDSRVTTVGGSLTLTSRLLLSGHAHTCCIHGQDKRSPLLFRVSRLKD
jgi:hypothetical protein